MSSEAPLETLATEDGRAYLGYRWAGGVTVRGPSGANERFSAGAASAALAEAVLRDRLGHEPAPTLVEAFSREWVEPRARGEFVWPLVALDEWLAAQDARDARQTAAKRPRRALLRALEASMTALPRSRPEAHPRLSLSPRGGH